jgi:hypothetical protein
VLTWNAPAGEQVEVYKIYTAFSPQSFDFNSPYLNTSTLSWTDTLAKSKQQKYYVVRAQDVAGNLENNTYKVGKFDIPLQQGYNLVSSPLVFFNSTISEVLQGQPVSEIVRYSAGFQTAVNNGSWHSDSGFTELQINKGYFFKAQSNYNLTLTGIVTEEQQNVALQQGLNLVGYTRLSSSGFDIFSQYPGNYSIQEVSQFVNHSYHAATYYPTIHWYSPENFNQLTPGNGYWLKLNKATTWSYSSK